MRSSSSAALVLGVMRARWIWMRLSRAALASGRGLLGNLIELARTVALDRQDRMQRQVDLDIPLVEEADDRIDQERHVVIGDVDEGHVGKGAVGIGDLRSWRGRGARSVRKAMRPRAISARSCRR